MFGIEDMGSIPVGDSDFFFVPGSCQVDQFTFQISLPSSKLHRLTEVNYNEISQLKSLKGDRVRLIEVTA